MKTITVNKIDKKRFDVLASYAKTPLASFFGRELAFFANEDESILALLIQDITDADFGAVILGRQEGGQYRTIDLKVSFAEIEKAQTWLEGAIKWHTTYNADGTPRIKPPDGQDILKTIVPPEKQHVYFSKIISNDAFLPGRQVINSIMPYYRDVDGNFVEQFQSTGFDARLWELCIFAYLREEELFVGRDQVSPDFIVEKYGLKVGIEAVTVGRKTPVSYFKVLPDRKPVSEMVAELEDNMPIRFGSPLFSKKQKRYWELPHMSEVPFVGHVSRVV